MVLPAPKNQGERERGALAFGKVPLHLAGLVHPPVPLTRKPACMCVSAAPVAWTFSRIHPWLDPQSCALGSISHLVLNHIEECATETQEHQGGPQGPRRQAGVTSSCTDFCTRSRPECAVCLPNPLILTHGERDAGTQPLHHPSICKGQCPARGRVLGYRDVRPEVSVTPAPGSRYM